MLWWVSSIAVCGYVLAAVWSAQVQLYNSRITLGLGIVLFVFFFFIPYFGFLIAYRLGKVQAEIADFANRLKFVNPANKSSIKRGFFRTEIVTFQISMIIGGLSFALVFVIWDIFWIILLGKYRLFSLLWNLCWLILWVVLWRQRHHIYKRWTWVGELIWTEPIDTGSQKGNKESLEERAPQVMSESKRRYIIFALIFASTFIASTASLLIIYYKSFTPEGVSGGLHLSSDTSNLALVLVAIISAIGTISSTILAWRKDRREARECELKVAQLVQELEASREKPALPISEEKRK